MATNTGLDSFNTVEPTGAHWDSQFSGSLIRVDDNGTVSYMIRASKFYAFSTVASNFYDANLPLTLTATIKNVTKNGSAVSFFTFTSSNTGHHAYDSTYEVFSVTGIVGEDFTIPSGAQASEGDLMEVKISTTGTEFYHQLTFRFYITKLLTITPPGSVQTNALNTFSVTQFTPSAGSALDAYMMISGNDSSAFSYAYVSASEKLSISTTGTVSSLVFYPNALKAQDCFTNNSATYIISIYQYLAGLNLKQRCTIARGYYSGGTITYNETVPQAAKPTLTLTATEVTGIGLLTQYGKYIQGKSRVQFTAAYTFKYGAKKDSFYLTAGNGYTTTDSLTISMTEDGPDAAEAFLADDYGAEVTATLNYDVYAYWEPELTKAVHRCLQDGTLDDSGAYCKIEWAIDIAPLGNQNAKSLSIVGPASTATPTLSSYTTSGYVIQAADTERSYVITFTLTDDFGSQVWTVNLSTAWAIMDIKNGGTGVAFGKVAEYDNCFEIRPDWTFRVGGQIFNPGSAATVMTLIQTGTAEASTDTTFTLPSNGLYLIVTWPQTGSRYPNWFLLNPPKTYTYKIYNGSYVTIALSSLTVTVTPAQDDQDVWIYKMA